MLDCFEFSGVEEIEKIQLQEVLMDLILTKKEEEGKIVFYGSEEDSLH